MSCRKSRKCFSFSCTMNLGIFSSKKIGGNMGERIWIDKIFKRRINRRQNKTDYV